jgi:antitoxin ParD1/3/4
MPTLTVDLSDQLDAFVQKRVELGRFGDVGEVVREGLRLLEVREREDDAKLELLRAAAQEGFDELDRGEGIRLASIDDLADYLDQIAAEVFAEAKAERASA